MRVPKLPRNENNFKALDFGESIFFALVLVFFAVCVYWMHSI